MLQASTQPLRISWAILCLLAAECVVAQGIALDHPTGCGPLTCYPIVDKAGEYRYLPTEPKIARDERGRPEFSFLRYIETAPSDGEGGLVQQDVGGIVHFLVDYSVDDRQRASALAKLREADDDAQLIGPVAFESGGFSLVSAVVEPAGGGRNASARRVLGSGRAPLVEGLKAAVSLHLTKSGTEILWASFMTDTPDISVLFEMSYSGFRDPAEARIHADWDRIEAIAETSVGARFAFAPIDLGFDYNNFWHKMQDSGGIVIDSKGDLASMQPLVDRTYARLQDMLFEPVPLERYEEDAQQKAIDRWASIARTVASRGSIFKLGGGYKRREVRRTGMMTFDYRYQTKDTITTAMAGNIGGLFAEYGGDDHIFKTVRMNEDPVFRRREITIYLDALNAGDFSRYINGVSFTLRKKHGSGRTSYQEVLFRRSDLENGSEKTLSYPWEREPSLDDWLNYQYDVVWSFQGGKTYEERNANSQTAGLALTPPFRYKKIEFAADPGKLAANGVRMVSVRVSHDFFGRTVGETINLIPDRGRYSEMREFAAPENNPAISYQITWALDDGRKITSEEMTSSDDLIYCDEMP
jgi:hypothetical protein